MSLVPGLGKESGEAPGSTGLLWFLRACVGLGFALWTAAMTQPLVDFGTTSTIGPAGVEMSSQAWPFSSRHMDPVALFPAVFFVVIVLAGVAVGARSSGHEGAAKLGELLCLVVGLVSLVALIWLYVVFSHKGVEATPLAGLWMVWIGWAVVGVPLWLSV